MSTGSMPHRYVVFGSSVRGARHVRKGAPNEDAIAWLPERGRGDRVVLSVADGHGSRRCFRADVGSQLAVRAANLLAWHVFEHVDHQSDVDRALNDFGERVVLWWQDAVRQHLTDHPLSDEEMAITEETRAASLGVDQLLLAYGSTLVVAAVGSSRACFVQLGDGDIVAIWPDGAATRPIERDDRIVADETTSLCTPATIREFRTASMPVGSAGPAMLLIATDGCSNSFETDDGFLQVGTDLLAMIAADGPAVVARRLPGLLGEMTAQGSGDDIALGVVCRTPPHLTG